MTSKTTPQNHINSTTSEPDSFLLRIEYLVQNLVNLTWK